MSNFYPTEPDIDRFRNRILVAGSFVLLMLIVLFARFVYLQVIQHDYYTTRAESNRISLVPITPNRGNIVDRNGVKIAMIAWCKQQKLCRQIR